MTPLITETVAKPLYSASSPCALSGSAIGSRRALTWEGVFEYQIYSDCMSRIIKMEEEDCPLSSHSYDHAFFNHCLTTFYDQDSNQDIIHAKCSAQDVFDMLSHSVDLCDTPLGEIMRIFEENSAFRGVDAQLVRRKVIKHKYLLKRMRAKDRKCATKERRQVVEIVPTCDQEEEFKKQRNRISAQISRDKKKEKVKALEELNQQLQQECQRQRLENEQLRADLEQSNQKTQGQVDRSLRDASLSNKLTKLLVLLGIIFLFGLIRDILTPSAPQPLPLTKINTLQQHTYPLSTEQSLPDDNQESRAKLMDSLEHSLSEVVEHRGLAVRIKERIGREMRGWKSGWGLTAKAEEQLLLIRKEAMQ